MLILDMQIWMYIHILYSTYNYKHVYNHTCIEVFLEVCYSVAVWNRSTRDMTTTAAMVRSLLCADAEKIKRRKEGPSRSCQRIIPRNLHVNGKKMEKDGKSANEY